MDLHPAAGVVTPEAVRLDFEPAGVGTRGVAFLIDFTLMLTTIWVVSLSAGIVAASVPAELPAWLAVVVALLLTFGVFWGYPIALETLWRGRTLGKMALGLRVVTVEGAPVRFRHASIRAILGLVDFGLLLGFVALLSALLTRRNQRLGDLVAGTIVVRERTGSGTPTAARFAVPLGAEPYAATIDPAGMTAEDYHAVRQFLLRARQMNASVRSDLARRLAVPLAARLHHTPPAGVPPELFLLCLAARYQQRGATSAGPPPATDAEPAPRPTAAPEAAAVPPPADGGFAPPS